MLYTALSVLRLHCICNKLCNTIYMSQCVYMSLKYTLPSLKVLNNVQFINTYFYILISGKNTNNVHA